MSVKIYLRERDSPEVAGEDHPNRYELQGDPDLKVKNVKFYQRGVESYQICVGGYRFNIRNGYTAFIRSLYHSLDEENRIIWEVRMNGNDTVDLSSINIKTETPIEVGKRYLFVNCPW